MELAPVEFANTGNYNFAGNFNPYTEAPLTGHVVWAQPLVPGSPGGQMGGEFGGTSESNFYSGFQYQPKFAPIIMNGILYYNAKPNYNSLDQGFVARDLRSGEILWTKELQQLLRKRLTRHPTMWTNLRLQDHEHIRWTSIPLGNKN